MKQVKISDLLDGMTAPDLALPENHGVSAHKIKEMTMMRLHSEPKTTRPAAKRGLSVLLAACLTLLLAVTAFAAVRVLMRQSLRGDTANVSFDAADGDYIALGNRYPQTIPDGYALDFVSEPSGGSQRVTYADDAGHYIAFLVQRAGSHGDIGINHVVSQESVTLPTGKGTLYTQENGAILVWTDDAAGLGYALDTDDLSADLVAMAESVRASDTALTPTYDGLKAEALAELGDYQITALPENFVLETFTAMPTSQGGGWYGYVNRHYVDTAANTYLTLNYETYSLDGQENTAQNVLALYGGGDSVSVSGHEGVCFTGDGYTVVRWVDTDACLVFALTSDTLTPVELVQLAQSVA